jgi:hypothetical protein
VSAKTRRQDTELVASIIDEPKDDAALNEPRRWEAKHPMPLDDYAQWEVQRSMDRRRLLQDFKWPDDVPPAPTAADFRKAAKALRNVAFTQEQQAIVRQLEAVEREPPEHANALKYHCAAEAYFLMEMFAPKAPTGSAGGPFPKIAGTIYEALTSQREGDAGADMKRSCDLVLRNRRRFQHRFSSTVR